MKSSIGKFLPKKLKRLIKIVFFYGKKYECPICGYTSRRLEPVGNDFPVLKEYDVIGGGSREAGCYRCESDDRERLIYLYLRDDLQIFNKHTNWDVLHIAPEKNLLEKLSNAPNVNYRAGDKFTEEYKYPSGVMNLDVRGLPFDDVSFELVICSHVLEHIPDDFRAMKELYRVLKPGGTAILQVPIANGLQVTLEDPSVTDRKDRERAFGQKDHVRIYGQDYTDRLQRAGFTPRRINIAGREGYQRFGLNPREALFIGLK